MPARLMPSYILAEVVPSPPPSAVAQRHPSHEVKSVDTHIAPIEAPPTIGVENLVEGFSGNGVVFEQPPPAIAPPPEPVRPGGDIKPPTRIRYAVPTYPFVAKMNRVQGIVIIEAIIGTDGKVEDAKVLGSTPLLDEAALEAVRAWEYTPTLLNGRPTPVIMTVTSSSG
jgi:TonB family protein